MRIAKSLIDSRMLGIAAGLALLVPLRAAAEGMPLDYMRYLYNPSAQQQEPLCIATGTPQMAKAKRYMSNFRSRIEAEGKGVIPLEHVPVAIAGLDKLAADPQLTAKVLGPQWRISKTAVYDFDDRYRDNKTCEMAKDDAGCRIRRVRAKGGKRGDAEMNVKPPGACKTSYDGRSGKVVFDKNGCVTNRVELGTSMHPRASMRAIARAKGSPLEWVQQRYGEDPGKFIMPAVDIHQDRTRYVLQHNDNYGKKDPKTGKALPESWNPLVDVSVDDVQTKKARGASSARGGFRFGALEADLNHPGSGSGLAIAQAKWDPPHSPADLKRPEFYRDSAVVAVNEVVPKLIKQLGIDFKPSYSKYTYACIGLGLIKESDVRATGMPNSRLRQAQRNSMFGLRNAAFGARRNSGFESRPWTKPVARPWARPLRGAFRR